MLTPPVRLANGRAIVYAATLSSLIACGQGASWTQAFEQSPLSSPLASGPSPIIPGPGYRGPPVAPSKGKVLDYDAKNVTLLSSISVSDFGSQYTGGSSCWGYVSPSGREYAVMGLSNGTAFVEITKPSDPKIITIIPGPASIWHEVKVFKQFAYAVNETGGGIQVIDLTGIDGGVVSLVKTFADRGVSSVHTLTLNPDSGILYTGGANNAALMAIDVNDPANPKTVGFQATNAGTYVHDSLVVTYKDGPYRCRPSG